MDIKPCGSVPMEPVPAENFTGEVFRDPIVEAPAPALWHATLVAFSPGARTNWHTPRLGQTLYVTQGCGLIQLRDGPIQVIRTGDVVRIPAGKEHWHGAAPTTGMSHIAMQAELNGRATDWLEPVTDKQYLG